MNMQGVYRTIITGAAAVTAFAATLSAQIVVVGTGDPDIDIAAVQSAADRGGSILLRGHFSFDTPPTKHGALAGLMATVIISKQVTISGTWDEHGDLTAIQGGEIPFAVEAPGAEVRIERLHFVHPKRYAIFVDEVSGLAIESCAIESVEPLPPPDNPTGIRYGFGIYVSTLLGLPTPERPGNLANVSGKLSILKNEISIAEAADEGMGIMMVSVGGAEKPVDIDISGNSIRNANQKGINMKQIGGRARIEHNIVTTSSIYSGRSGALIAGIHCGGTGTYLIAHNRVDIADPNGAGIRLRAYPGLNALIESATVVNNDVTISAAENADFGAASAGIEIRGFARNNVVKGNRIRGRARVAMSLATDSTGIPSANTFEENDHKLFISSPADGGRKK